jgi:hypothetical protein
MNPIEFELNNTKLKVFSSGDIWKFGFKGRSKSETWHQIKGYINLKKIYKRRVSNINGKIYTNSRIIYKAFNLEWNINDASPDNTIDHIDRNSLNNDIANLRVANMTEQSLNKDCVINAKGYSWHKQKNKWRAYIKIDGKHKHLGHFDTDDEARQAYLFAVANR